MVCTRTKYYAANKHCAILSYDTLPLRDNAVITPVILKFKYASVSGINPFSTHGKLLADICAGVYKDNAARGDFNATCLVGRNKAPSYTHTKFDNWYSKALNALDLQYINPDGVTQFRLRITLDNNNDLGADFLKIFSGDVVEADRPQLIIEYYFPLQSSFPFQRSFM
jgi:hypothetical protein